MTIICKLRRMTAVLAVAAVLLCGFSVMATATPCDINGDGITSTTDARLLLLSLLGNTELTEEQRLAADLDGDGVFTTSDIRLLLVGLTQDPIATTSTRPIQTTTTDAVPTTLPTTTTTAFFQTTTGPDCVSTYTTTTVTTTMPVAAFTITVDTVLVRAGDTFTLSVRISQDHALVGFEMDVNFDSSELTLLAVNDEPRNPYATDLNTAIFNEQAQWRFSQFHDGILNVRYVTAAENGSREDGVFFTLTFRLSENAEYHQAVSCVMRSHLCSADGIEYTPYINITDGIVKVRSRTTQTTTTGTTDVTLPTTDTTYPPTTTTTWVLTGPDGTAPTTIVPTATPTTLPYGDPLCFTGETVA